LLPNTGLYRPGVEKTANIIVKNYTVGTTAHKKLQIFFSPKNLNTYLKVGYLKCEGERKHEGLYTSV